MPPAQTPNKIITLCFPPGFAKLPLEAEGILGGNFRNFSTLAEIFRRKTKSKKSRAQERKQYQTE
jgi:hypothetical protein